ncbi:hypothetical protein GGTG_05795 [Gaeumannomyces tritici R3-111a-1]|uniref:Uncharacterized protein n=1 Tax=Gaeumannomyces tritici (strain R3-111a-1) TaxID=644352 RepID=J3NWY4_GAET3|nr:hypothetical protein GGTG_05795 [Gaeumannomyces tritici R3-111a-1]EJT75866.1 hypothetical protein GGTG_05795 [Gaeumannomyces tritici R3-111a-1]
MPIYSDNCTGSFKCIYCKDVVGNKVLKARAKPPGKKREALNARAKPPGKKGKKGRCLIKKIPHPARISPDNYRKGSNKFKKGICDLAPLIITPNATLSTSEKAVGPPE